MTTAECSQKLFRLYTEKNKMDKTGQDTLEIDIEINNLEHWVKKELGLIKGE